ncbi:MAG: MerR family transcriptional regulator [Oscillospiraceae bacterium]|nr:MerR family transcriptional regulator [Oscillospiraceae bacterium]
MKMRIKQFADMAGVSVRTLHYYDEIGLLRPAETDKWTGYRFYDGDSLARMQEIMFFRELGFTLNSISDILSSPDYDRGRALLEHKKLLIMKKERLERLIAAVDDAVKGEIVMKAFDNTAFEQYRAEVKKRWGETEAYAQYVEKSRGRRGEKQNEMLVGMDEILGKFALCMKSGDSPDSGSAQELVKELQGFISANFYDCTDQILAGLGEMYVADERFRENIDRHGQGTAQYISRAIQHSSREQAKAMLDTAAQNGIIFY